MDRERVHPLLQLRRERSVDETVTLDPALPCKGLSHNIDPEMALAARPMPGVALMLAGFVDHAQAFRLESLGQLSCDEVMNAHGLALRAGVRRRQRLGTRTAGIKSKRFVKLAAVPFPSA
jgi:hypothetical protein